MPLFRYVARDPQGKQIEGTLESSDRSAAIREIEKTKGLPVRIQLANDPAPPPNSQRSASPSKSGTSPAPTAAPSLQTPAVQSMSYGQQHLFTEQLALLLNAGMTLDEALGILVRRMKHPKLHGLSKALHMALVEGRSLSQALRDYPKIFSPLYVNMVAAGEASGTLGDILKRLVTYLSEVKQLRDRVQQALVYPALLVVVGALMVTVFMTVMVPKLMRFFTDTSQELPFATRLLMDVHGAMVRYWWTLLPLGFGVSFLFRAWTASPAGRQQWDALQWKIPGYGSVLRHRYYAQFARTLGTLIQNGVTLLRALELIEDIAGNAYVRERMKAVQQAVVDGTTLSTSLSHEAIFPELFVDMLAVGEQSGRLAETLNNIADVYDRELDKQVKLISTLIPPLVMVGIAIVVGFVVFGILSAVFSMTKGLRPGSV
jgi:type II secretory pathway component PulF